MDPRYLTAFEHQPLTVADKPTDSGVTFAEAEQLDFLGERRRGFCERGYRSIKLAQYCGVVSLGERMLEILPKVDESRSREECQGILLRLLRAAERFPLFRDRSAGHHLRHAPLLDVFIAAFFDAVAEIVRGGLHRQYREREEDLQVVRGRIMTGRQFAMHANRPDRIACRFDDLTADNVWNRLIKAALHAVRPWMRSVELHRRWVELVAVFDEVEDVELDSRALDRLVFDRHAARYRTVIDWVTWIFRLLSPSLRAGENAAPGLLFDMNALFESAVASVLRRRVGWSSGLSLQSQDTTHDFATIRATKRAVFGLRPDLVVRCGADVVAIADTKWKRLGDSTGYLMPAQSDLYQMHAYATAFECEQLALIYPWHGGLTGARETAFVLPRAGALRPVVHVVCIDLSKDSFAWVRGEEFLRVAKSHTVATAHFGGLHG